MHPPAASVPEPLGELVRVVMQVHDDVVDALACYAPGYGRGSAATAAVEGVWDSAR